MMFLWFCCVNLLFRNEVFLIPPPDIKQVRIRCLQTRKSSTWRISLEMSGKGKPGFPVLMPCFWGLFRWTRPGYGFRICSWTTDINPQNQPSTGTSGKDIVNDFSLRYQFDPIMIIRNQFRNVYISSWAGTPNKIWGNFQWNIVSWDFSGFKKRSSLQNVLCCLSVDQVSKPAAETLKQWLESLTSHYAKKDSVFQKAVSWNPSEMENKLPV